MAVVLRPDDKISNESRLLLVRYASGQFKLLSWMVNFGRWLKIFFLARKHNFSTRISVVLKEITVLSNIDLKVRSGILSFPKHFARNFTF